MNHSGTVRQSNILVADHIECLLMLIGDPVCGTLIQRFVFLVFQILPLVRLDHLIRALSLFRQRSKHRIKKRFCHVIGISVDTSDLSVRFNRVDTESKVRRQCPRRCRPCKDICILVLHLETHDRGTFLHILVPLRYFLR